MRKKAFDTFPMNLTEAQIERAVCDGAERLLGRASDEMRARFADASPDRAALVARLRAVLAKYMLRSSSDAPSASQVATPISMEAVAKFLDELHADDLCLVIACECGDDAAWSDLMERFGATIRSAARGSSANAEAAEELTQSIWAELYGLRARATGGTTGKLAHYSGRGSLGGWLRAVVGQLAIDRHRQSARFVQMETEADTERSAHEQEMKHGATQFTTALNPEHDYAAREAAAVLHAALAQSLQELRPEDRLLIKLYYFDNLRLREAGAVLGVHEATASRRLTNLHKQVRRSVTSVLIEKYGWTQAEVERSLEETAATLDGDLSRLLTNDKPPEKTATTRREAV